MVSRIKSAILKLKPETLLLLFIILLKFKLKDSLFKLGKFFKILNLFLSI